MTEQWLPIPGLEGKYEASDTGLVRSLDRRIECAGRGSRNMRGRVLSQHIGTHGYMAVSLGGKTRTVHRVILETFVGPCPDGMEGCHNDGDRYNNNVSNLRWDTRYENCQDIRRAGTHWQTRKTTCPRGHQYDGEVTHSSGRITRYCKTCH